MEAGKAVGNHGIYIAERDDLKQDREGHRLKNQLRRVISTNWFSIYLCFVIIHHMKSGFFQL